VKNSEACRSVDNESKKTERYFAKYALKVSQMNAWMIEEELARKLVDYDEASGEENRLQSIEKIMKEIEILQSRKDKKCL
jgi:hypothetical protein